MIPLLLQFEPPALSGIVPAFDVLKDIRPRLGSRPIVSPVDPFPLEHAKEALGGRIVGATAHHTHTTSHLMRRQEPLVFIRRELTAAIEMQNDRGASGPLPDGHKDRLDDELTVLPRTHGPAHDHARIQIQHNAEVQLMLGGANVGDVGHPFGVGSCGRKVSLQMVVGSSGRCP